MFKLLIPVLGFAVSSVANIFILIVFHDLGMLPGKLCDEIVSVRNAERVKPITCWCTVWKVAVRIGGENIVLQALQCRKVRVHPKFTDTGGIHP